ncbi:DUF4377 domain-containing protein [Ignatzschineria sp. LJL83]
MKKLLGIGLLGGFLAACASFSGETVMLKIASSQANCVGIVPQKCLLVEEITDIKTASNKTEEWSYFYSNIEGFNYEPGFEYIVEVQKTPRENVAMDQSSIIYRLGKVVSKESKTSNNMPKTLSMTKLRSAK